VSPGRFADVVVRAHGSTPVDGRPVGVRIDSVARSACRTAG
jgi:hypothetical protein